jgi:hypothetical protein
MGCSFVAQQTAWLTACTEATAFACSDAASLKMDSKASHGDIIAGKKKQVLHQANTHTKLPDPTYYRRRMRHHHLSQITRQQHPPSQ